MGLLRVPTHLCLLYQLPGWEDGANRMVPHKLGVAVGAYVGPHLILSPPRGAPHRPQGTYSFGKPASIVCYRSSQPAIPCLFELGKRRHFLFGNRLSNTLSVTVDLKLVEIISKHDVAYEVEVQATYTF